MTDHRQNRIQSFAFVISACAAFCFACYFKPHFFNTNSAQGTESAQLNNQVNPNTASVESLIRLPDIGFSRAEAIIQYRNAYTEKNSNRQAFETYEDLQNIKGIGPKTTQNIKELLKFK
jgi:competence ComEA-like helix-hairpin-helix protein